ncbi:efflux RND transporter periplasmic adaptor subunit [Colwellia echini]|nr:biotin/lipoyl-binding protein [Colwellia echini]
MKNKPSRLVVFIAAAFSYAVTSNNLMANAQHDDHQETHNAAHTNESSDDHHKEHDDHSDQHNDHHGEKDEHGHSDKHGDDHGDEHGDEHEEGHVEISHDNAKKAGIINATAGVAHIKQTITLYGRVVVKPESISHVSARFPGLITQLTVNVGDTVKAGEVIAAVESNNSFKHYNVVAPISGVITARYANPGELTGQKALVIIENYEELWVNFNVFPSNTLTNSLNNASSTSSTSSNAKSVKKGMKVTVSSSPISDQTSLESSLTNTPQTAFQSSITETNIIHLLNNKSQPFTTAITPLDNKQGTWTAGQLLTGSVVLSENKVELAIDNRAFQEVEGKQVIFVVNEHGYESREVSHKLGSDIILGQSDGHFTEILSGLNAGEQYAVQNSYLLKADLGKAGAAHVH